MTFGDDIAKGLFSAGKTLHTEHKRRQRDARSVYSPRDYTEPETTLKEAVFDVIEEAMAAASGGGMFTVSGRTLYYQVRPRIQGLTDRELNFGYFSQTLLVEYQEVYGPLSGLTRDPRGNLHEPHTGLVVPLGTLEVASYQFPEYVFDKIIYVEKEGLDPIWERAQLAERYDMAIASGKGFPAEAVRLLFEQAEAGDYKLFVIHDADPSGYGIARVMREETRRMPGYNVDVIDLGLSVADAIERGLPTEQFTRKKALPWWMRDELTETELAWFSGHHIGNINSNQWECTRVELNAFTAPELVAYVEEGLAAHGADNKVVPPDAKLDEEAENARRIRIRVVLDKLIEDMLDTEAILAQLVDSIGDAVIADPAAMVAAAFEDDRSQSWSAALTNGVDARVEEHLGALEARARQLIREATAEDGAEGEDE